MANEKQEGGAAEGKEREGKGKKKHKTNVSYEYFN